MDLEQRPGAGNGRALVATVLAVLGVFFALDAAVVEPSRTRVAFIVLSVLMILGAGATLGAAVAVRRRR